MQQNCFQRHLSKAGLSSNILKIRQNPFGVTCQNKALNILSFSHRAPTLVEIILLNKKRHKMVFLLLWKSERRKNNCYLVFADKNEVFLFSKGVNIKHGWLLHRKPMFHSRNPKTTGGFQNNRVNCSL